MYGRTPRAPAKRQAGPVRAGFAFAVLLVVSACSHQTLLLGPEPASVVAPSTRAPLSLGSGVAWCDRTRRMGDVVAERFAREVRDSGLVQGVMYPVPAGADPLWELELVGHDSAHEPDSNFWKAALAAGLVALAPFISLENDDTLRREALVLRRRKLVGSYTGEARIQHRYGLYANKHEMSADGFELAVREATRALLAELARHLPELVAQDRGR